MSIETKPPIYLLNLALCDQIFWSSFSVNGYKLKNICNTNPESFPVIFDQKNNNYLLITQNIGVMNWAKSMLQPTRLMTVLLCKETSMHSTSTISLVFLFFLIVENLMRRYLYMQMVPIKSNSNISLV